MNQPVLRAILHSAGAIFLASTAAQAVPINIDLTTLGAEVNAAGATWIQQNNQPTGTGVYQPFLRVQQKGTEEGFNTDTHKVLNNKDGVWTHSIKLGDLATETFNGVEYYRFELDANEPQAGIKSQLTLDKFKLYTSSNAGAATFSSLAQLQANSVLRYDLDQATGIGGDGATEDHRVQLETALKPGSGSDDMAVRIAKSFFAGAALTDYLILQSAFGKSDDDAMSQGGFEEWRALMSTGGTPVGPCDGCTPTPDTPTPTPTVPPGPGGGGAPEPGTLVLLASGAVAGTLFKRRQERRK